MRWSGNQKLAQIATISEPYTTSRKNLHAFINLSIVLWGTSMKEHLPTAPIRITSSEVPPFLSEMANHCNIPMWFTPWNKRKIIWAMDVLKRSKAWVSKQKSYSSLLLQFLLVCNFHRYGNAGNMKPSTESERRGRSLGCWEGFSPREQGVYLCIWWALRRKHISAKLKVIIRAT